MNKLTEIKQRNTNLKEFIMLNKPKLTVWEEDWLNEIFILLSLLEEKDKALAFYADDKNYGQEKVPYDEDIPNDCYYECPEVLQDKGERAKNALLTSSNTEGE